MIYELNGKAPRFNNDRCYVAPSADLVGDITLGDNTSIWFGVVMRADNDSISVGPRTNVQDGAVIHVDKGYPVTIGDEVTIGHRAMVHGCTIKSGALIGINSVVLNGAIIGKDALVGANALVTEGTVIPDNALALGSPAKVVRFLEVDELANIRLGMKSYTEKITQYRAGLRSLSPLCGR